MKKIIVLMSLGFIALFNSFNSYAYIELDSAILETSNAYYLSTPESNINQFALAMSYNYGTQGTLNVREVLGYAWAIESLNDLIYIIDLQSTMTLFNDTTPVFTINPHMIIFNTGDTLINSYVQFIDRNGVVIDQISYDDIYYTSTIWRIEYEVQLIDLQEYYRGYDDGFKLGYEQGYNLGRDSGFNEGLEDGKILGFNFGRETYGHWDGTSWLTATEYGLSAFQQGYLDGLEEQNPFGIYDMVGHGFNVLGAILDRDIWPGFKIGYLLYIPLGFALLMFFLKFKKGS